MKRAAMERRRNRALDGLQDAINQLGPITDQTRGIIREPVLDVIGRIYKAGEELQLIRFDVEDDEPQRGTTSPTKGRPRRSKGTSAKK